MALFTRRREILRALEEINEKLGEILMSQSDIDNVTAEIEAEVTDLGTKDAAILAAQNAFTAEIATLQGQGVNTTALVAAAAQLVAAHGANDSTVAALTAASAPPAPAPAPVPAPAGS
jgi:hypothetical protein